MAGTGKGTGELWPAVKFLLLEDLEIAAVDTIETEEFFEAATLWRYKNYKRAENTTNNTGAAEGDVDDAGSIVLDSGEPVSFLFVLVALEILATGEDLVRGIGDFNAEIAFKKTSKHIKTGKASYF